MSELGYRRGFISNEFGINYGVSFFLPMKKIPTVTAQQKRITVKNGKPVVYASEALKAAEEQFCGQLSRVKPDKPWGSGIALEVFWCFLNTNNHHIDGEPKLTRPDTDNLQKLFKDCMTKVGFWKDDAQVFSETIRKTWSDVSGVFVRVIYVDIEDFLKRGVGHETILE